MANKEHLELLKQGAAIWNEWRKDNIEPIKRASTDLNEVDLNGIRICLNEVDLSEANLSDTELTWADLTGANLSRANLTGTQLSWSNLNKANLTGANLSRVNLSRACLTGVNLSGANLTGANLVGVNLSGANLTGANLTGANLSEADLGKANLSRAYLSEAKLVEAKLVEANLSGANLSRANLCNVNLIRADLSSANLIEVELTRVQALETNFTGAKLTGACLEEWHINSSTKLNDINCQYIYLKSKRQERRPRYGEFAPSEFTKLFQIALETVDLIFTDGIDWKAFLSSLQELKANYGEDNISVQGIEKKNGDAFLIRLEVLPGIDKAEIENQAKQLYEIEQIKREAIYQTKLEAKDEQIKIHLQNNANLSYVIHTLASRPVEIHNYNKAESTFMSESYQSKYDQKGAQIGGIVDTAASGSNVRFTQNNNNAPEQQKNLAEAAAEIQQLLEQLSKTYPTDTRSNKMKLAAEATQQIENNPTLMQKTTSALKAGSTAALEQLLSHPAASFVIAALEDWQDNSK